MYKTTTTTMAINHNYCSCFYYSTYLSLREIDIPSAFNRPWHILKSWQILAAHPHLPWLEPALSLAGWVLEKKKKKVINMFRQPWNLYLKKTKWNCFPKTASNRSETLSHLLQRRVNITLSSGLTHTSWGSHLRRGLVSRVSQELFFTHKIRH